MSTALPQPMTLAQFLAWEREQERPEPASVALGLGVLDLG